MTSLPSFGACLPSTVAVHAIRYDDSLGAGHPLPTAVAAAAPTRRAEHVAGRSCAREALRRAGGPATAEVGIGPMRAPAWPAGFTGSITHAASIAIAAVAPTTAVRALGIDLEPIVTPGRVDELAPLILGPDELARAADAFDDRAAAFTAVFAAKEALFKALAPMVGRYFDFRDAELIAARPDLLHLRLAVDLDATWRTGATFAVTLLLDDALVFAALALSQATPAG